MAPKRLKVRGLRRVSGDKQDSEMQLREMKKFCEKMSNEDVIWDLEYVYDEDDVSAFKNLIEQREIMNQVLKDAEKKQFDLFLAYKFDRIGRKGINTQNWIYKMNEILGIPVWSTDEGILATETMVDQIKLSIYAGKAQQESIDTSKRTNDNHEMLVEKCIFRGGTPPYGYKLVRSGELGSPLYNKKGKELMAKIINEEEAYVVRIMFDLVYYYAYGSNRITKHLNNEGIKNRTGGTWSAGVIRYILRNPIYKGLYTYGKTRSVLGKKEKHRQPKENWIHANKINPDWIIINALKFDKVQDIIDYNIDKYKLRKGKNKVETGLNLPSKSKLLFGGFAFCGHCKSAMSITTNKKAGKVRVFYRCVGKAFNRVECTGQTTYSKERIENSVLMQIYEYIETLKEIDYTSEIMKYNEDKTNRLEKEYSKNQKIVNEIEEEIVALNIEIGKVLINKSKFTQESLSQAIEVKKKEMEEAKEEMKKAEDAIQKCIITIDDLKTLQETIPKWQQEFEISSFERKKMLLAMIIDKIEIYRDSISLNIKVNLQDMLNNWLSNTQKGERA